MMISARQSIPIRFYIPQADLKCSNYPEKQKPAVSGRVVYRAKTLKKGKTHQYIVKRFI
jgi:hypothetical protein